MQRVVGPMIIQSLQGALMSVDTVYIHSSVWIGGGISVDSILLEIQLLLRHLDVGTCCLYGRVIHIKGAIRHVLLLLLMDWNILMSRIQVTHCKFRIFPLTWFNRCSGIAWCSPTRVTCHIRYLSLRWLIVRILKLVTYSGMNVSIANRRTSEFVAYILDTWFWAVISIYLRLVYIIKTRLRLLNHLVRIMLLIVVLVHDDATSCRNPFNFGADRWPRSVCAILQMRLRIVSVEWLSPARLVLACIDRVAFSGVAAHEVLSSLISCTLLFHLNSFK